MENTFIQSWIDFDKQYQKLFLNQSELTKTNRYLQLFLGGKAVFVDEENNKVYKIIGPKDYYKSQSLVALFEALNVDFLEPTTLYYDGVLLKILSQQLLTPMPREHGSLPNIIIQPLYKNRNQKEVDIQLFLQLGAETYAILKDIANTFGILDISRNNLGINSEGLIRLFDYEGKATSEDKINSFFERYGLPQAQKKDPFYFLYSY